ncbi:MAG: hypothetical protein RSE50_12700, partial [Myroides sp.]
MKLSEAIKKYGDCEVKSELIDLINVKQNNIYYLKKGDAYYHICTCGYVEENIFRNGDFEKACSEIGNIFLTEYEAEIALEKLKVETILRKYSRDFRQEEWKDGFIDKYYIEYNEYDNEIRRPCTRFSKKQGTIFFKTEEDCQNAIDEVGEQRLIN